MQLQKYKSKAVHKILTMDEKKSVMTKMILNAIDRYISDISHHRTMFRNSKQSEFDRRYHTDAIISAQEEIGRLKQILADFKNNS